MIGRPSLGKNPKNITFSAWEETRHHINNFRMGYKSEEINTAICLYARNKNPGNRDIVYQIDEHEKVIEQRRRLITSLKAELTRRDQEALEDKKQDEKTQYQFDGFCKFIQECKIDSSKWNTKRVNSEFGTSIKGFDDFKKIMELFENGKFTIEMFKKL